MNLDQSYIQNLPISDDVQLQLSRINERKNKIEEVILEASQLKFVFPKRWNTQKQLKALVKEAMLKGEKSQQIPTVKIFKVKLQETETLTLFELISTVASRDSVEGKEMEFYNEAFEKYKKLKAELHFYDSETQTPNPCFLKRLIQTKPIIKKDKASTATEWDMFDSFKKLERMNAPDDVEEDFDEKFYEASQLCQRVLASNRFHDEQITFITKHQPSRSMIYAMDVLWEMKENGSGEANCICVHPINKKIVAVGYGDRGCKGLVCVWNAKNPQCPERRLEVSGPVSALDFSKTKPRYLAFTTELGEILIVDLTLHRTDIVPLFKIESKIIKEPEWAVAWMQYEDMGKITERVITVGHNGEVRLWDPHQNNNKTLAVLIYNRTPNPDIYVRELEPEYELGERNFLESHYICHSIELDPVDRRVYYVTTNEGSILTCRTRSVLGEMEIKAAHTGAVLGMKHSPFTHLVYLSHGADFVTKIWIKGIKDPILIIETLTLSPILCALWSTSHSTCLVTLSRQELCFWDISRSILDPVNIEERKEAPFFTTAAFTNNGTSLYVGLTDGTVIAYRLSDMPHPPYLQVNHIHGALKKMLTNKVILKEIDEILGPVAETS